LPQNKIPLKRSKEIKVGIFTIIGITLLIFGYNFLKGFNPLRGYNKYFVVYDNVNGIVKSTQVTINGLKVGQVEEIGMLREGDPSKILVTLILENTVKLPVGTTASISSQGLLGSTDIVVVPATGTTYLNSKDTLVAGYEESLTGIIQKIIPPLKEKSEQVLVTLDKVLLSINSVFDSTSTKNLTNGIDDLSGTLRNMRSITARFDKLTAEENEKLKSMFENIESITHNLKNNNEAIATALKNISKITDSVAAADLTATINHTRTVMKEFSVTLEKINKGEGSLGKLANDSSLYVNLNSTSEELTSLMKDMQAYPGRYFSVSVFGGTKRADKQDKKREESQKKK
jgi:phospholipid/cholesterol/gamma-HCH transport system substrate-binding protein